MGLLNSVRNLASTYAKVKKTKWERTLQNAETRIDSGGSVGNYSFQGQEIDFAELRDIKEMRESGGLVAQLVHAKALMYFGTGVEFHIPDEEEPEEVIDGEPTLLTDYLEDLFNDINTKVLDLGEDSIWYPYGACEITETRGGDFGGIVGIEPWTLKPEVDAHGEIVAWIQQTKANGQNIEQRFEPDDIKHFVINKRSARDEIGISQVLRSEEEITQYKENQRAMRNAIEMHGFPEWHIAAGREGAAPLDDNELRRIVNLFEQRRSNGDTVTATGPDVELNRLDPGDIALEEVTSNDLQQLAISLGVPIEAVDFGSEGLGSGEQSRLRETILKLDILATQRTYMNQWVTEIIRPVLEEYTPYDSTVPLEMRLEDPLTGNEEMADLINKVGSYMETNEARSKLDLPEKEELEGEYGAPAEDEGGEGGLDQIFNRAAENRVETVLENRDLEGMRTLQEEFDAELFELVATDEQEDFETGDRLGIGVEFPNSGVYVDWNIEAWDEEERLDGPHVSEYATKNDAQKVAQGELRELSAIELSDGQGDTDFSHYEDWERSLDEMHNSVYDADADRRILSYSGSQTPEFVTDWIETALWDENSVFSDIENLSGTDLMQVREFMAEQLTESDGWSIDGVADQLLEVPGIEDRDRAETIARTETGNTLKRSREIGYESQGFEDDLYYWSGDADSDRTTDCCKYLVKGFDANLENPGAFSGLDRPDGTNPFEGGKPMQMDELKDHIKEVAEADPSFDTAPRTWTPHINCRKSFTRAPPDMV